MVVLLLSIQDFHVPTIEEAESCFFRLFACWPAGLLFLTGSSCFLAAQAAFDPITAAVRPRERLLGPGWTEFWALSDPGT